MWTCVTVPEGWTFKLIAKKCNLSLKGFWQQKAQLKDATLSEKCYWHILNTLLKVIGQL